MKKKVYLQSELDISDSNDVSFESGYEESVIYNEISDSAYNCRVYDYPEGTHVTFYKQAINKGIKVNEKLKKSYVNKDRSSEEKKHCAKVSASASKNRIYNIARSNTWNWFITITFDREKVDSSNYDDAIQKMVYFLNNIRKRKCPAMKYLIVPELHKDGIHFHFHGLLAHCEELHMSFSGHYTRGRNSKPIFNILDWSFGFTTATRVGDSGRASSYITKYITKDCATALKNKKRYTVSQNVSRALPEYFVQDEMDFIKLYSDRIVYTKSVEVKEASQIITYYELKD